MSRRFVSIAVATISATALSVSLAPVATANEDDVIRRGSCSGSSDWKLKAKPDDGRLEVEGEVDSNVVGQTWRWRIRHDGDVSARGRRVTKAPSGSFSVERRVVNGPGTDSIGWRARNPKSGEVCRGRLTL